MVFVCLVENWFPPLAIEVGRFTAIQVENWIFNVYDLNYVENEFHFMFDCTLYDDLKLTI